MAEGPPLDLRAGLGDKPKRNEPENQPDKDGETQMDRLKGKNVVITGAAGGMGLVACRRFAEEGARIFATDLRPGAAQEVQAIDPGAITYAAADVTSQDGIRAIVTAPAPLWMGGSTCSTTTTASSWASRSWRPRPRTGTACTIPT
jgi:hypothetical protein